MHKIKVIKAHSLLRDSVATTSPLPYADELSVAEFRGFLNISGVMIPKVRHPLALETMIEIIETVHKDLLSQKKVLSLS